MTASPITAPCPVCNAGPGEPCNAPTDTGRRNVTWFHYKRSEHLWTTDGFEAVYELNRQEIGYLLERLGVDPDLLPARTRSVRVALDGGLKVSVDRGVWTLPLGTWYQ